MKRVAKSYRGQYLDPKSDRFERRYYYQIKAVDEMLGTERPVEIQCRDYRATEVFRRKLYELQNSLGVRFKVSRKDPYTLIISLKESPPTDDIVTIGGKPVEKVEPVVGISLEGEVNLTPEQEQQVVEAMERYKQEEGQNELDTDGFLESLFGKGSQNVKGDEP